VPNQKFFKIFGQSGGVADLYRHFKLDTNALVEAVINQSAD